MTDLIALAFVIYLLVKYGWSAVWWALGILAFALILRVLLRKNRKENRTIARGLRERPRTRIDHPHYLTDDEYECTVCGTRFRSNADRCPHCGVIFNRTAVSEDEFVQELEEEMDMDDWDGENGR